MPNGVINSVYVQEYVAYQQMLHYCSKFNLAHQKMQSKLTYLDKYVTIQGKIGLVRT